MLKTVQVPLVKLFRKSDTFKNVCFIKMEKTYSQRFENDLR